LAAVGATEVEVFKLPTVAILSTGDEVWSKEELSRCAFLLKNAEPSMSNTIPYSRQLLWGIQSFRGWRNGVPLKG